MTHLREWQRYQIAAKLEVGCTKKEIAEYLHVHPSTITREIHPIIGQDGSIIELSIWTCESIKPGR